MVNFKEDSDLGDLQFALMRDGSVNLYLKSKILTTVLKELRFHNYKIVEIDCTKWRDTKTALKSIAKSLQFPSYFGENLDALRDCLKDVDIPLESGLALVFHRIDSFAENDHEYFSRILDILEATSRYQLLFGKRLIILAQSDDPNIEFSGIGETALKRNTME